MHKKHWFLGVRIIFTFTFNLNKPFLLTHPPTRILTLFELRIPHGKMDRPLIKFHLLLFALKRSSNRKFFYVSEFGIFQQCLQKKITLQTETYCTDCIITVVNIDKRQEQAARKLCLRKEGCLNLQIKIPFIFSLIKNKWIITENWEHLTLRYNNPRQGML